MYSQREQTMAACHSEGNVCDDNLLVERACFDCQENTNPETASLCGRVYAIRAIRLKWVVRFAQSVSQLVKSNPLGSGYRACATMRTCEVQLRATEASTSGVLHNITRCRSNSSRRSDAIRQRRIQLGALSDIAQTETETHRTPHDSTELREKSLWSLRVAHTRDSRTVFGTVFYGNEAAQRRSVATSVLRLRSSSNAQVFLTVPSNDCITV